MKNFYDLCWECYDKNADYYLELWYNDIAGHSINCFKCEVCGKEPNNNTSTSLTDQSELAEVSTQENREKPYSLFSILPHLRSW